VELGRIEVASQRETTRHVDVGVCASGFQSVRGYAELGCLELRSLTCSPQRTQLKTARSDFQVRTRKFTAPRRSKQGEVVRKRQRAMKDNPSYSRWSTDFSNNLLFFSFMYIRLSRKVNLAIDTALIQCASPPHRHPSGAGNNSNHLLKI
jgi:hypothetical protein